jgi:cell wall-associated NlpC family hydrolase
MISSGLSGGKVALGVSHPSYDQRRFIVVYASLLVGTPYTYAGEGELGIDCGFDCSGLVRFVYNNTYGNWVFPIDLTANQMRKRCGDKNWIIPNDQKSAGDLLLFSSHIGIYSGEGTMIHALGRVDHDYGEVGWLPDVPEHCDFKYEPIYGNTRRVIEQQFVGNSYWEPRLKGVCRPKWDLDDIITED